MEAQMKREAKVKVREAAAVLLPMLAEALETTSPEKPLAQIDGLWFHEDYIRATYNTLTRLVNGQPVDYEALYQSITLEMMANSKPWCDLRLWARRLS